MRVKTPPLEELRKEYNEFGAFGRVSVSKDYFNPFTVGGVKHKSSWDRTLDEAISRSKNTPYWITLIYRREDNSHMKLRGYRFPERFIGFVDTEGKFHKFKWITRLRTAIKMAFKEVGFDRKESDEINDS